MPVAFFNNEFLEEDEIKISLTNRNFLYGDGLFETVRSINGQPVFINHHVIRLKKCMRALQLSNDDFFSETNLTQAISRLNSLNKISGGGRARILIFRNEGGTYMPLQNTASCIIRTEALEQNNYILNQSGISIGLYDEIKKPINKFSAFKTCNSLLYVLASVYAQQNKFNDCLILNEENNICEATSSNIFWIHNSCIFTTPLSQGCVGGVLRSVLVQEYFKEFFISEKKCTINDLMNADELFLTNSIGGFRWVQSFREKMYDNTITKHLTEKFAATLQ